MSKMRDLMRGTRAIHVVELPLVNVPNAGAEPSPELDEARKRDAEALGTTVEQLPVKARVGLRVLLPRQWLDVQTAARALAVERGNPNPTEDDPNYNLGTQVNTLARACVDPDSNPSDPDLFFGDGKTIESAVKDLLDNEHLTRDSLTYLCDEWEWWNDRVNPQIKNLSDHERLAFIGRMVETPDIFLSLRPGVQRSLAHFMAVQLWSLSMLSSESGGGSTTSTLSGPKPESSLLQ